MVGKTGRIPYGGEDRIPYGGITSDMAGKTGRWGQGRYCTYGGVTSDMVGTGRILYVWWDNVRHGGETLHW